MQRWILPSAGLAALLLAVGCGQSQSAADQHEPTPAEATTQQDLPAPPRATEADTPIPARATLVPTGTPAPAPTPPSLMLSATTPASVRPTTPVAKFIALATRDLAARLSISANQITASSAEPVIWPDAALGCPRPGQVYPQGRVPGFRIVLDAQAQQYTYHTDEVGQLVFCPSVVLDAVAPGTPAGPGAGPSPQIGVPIR